MPLRSRTTPCKSCISISAVTGALLSVAIFPQPIQADELADTLAPQFVYMEACKDIAPPLPPDRLRSIDAMHEIVDEGELRKSMARLIVKLGGSKDNIKRFCSTMSDMIKNEQH
jgi:hypothetical protein